MEFERIDDFSRYLMLQDGQAFGRSFQYLVDRHFDYIEKGDGTYEKQPYDLLLCFLELTTLVEEEVIGETFLRSHMMKNAARNFINKYKAIVQKVKKDPSCVSSISGFEQWYRMGTFLLIGTNTNVNDPKTRKVTSWDGQPPGTIMDFNKKRELYATSDDALSEQDVKDYLTLYYDLLNKDLEFGQYPNVCVIVKPISVTDGESYIPLGNLYLHFATRTPKTRSFYLRFINDFMRVWYYEKGYEIITEIERFAVSEAIENNEVLRYHLNYIPNFDGQKKKRLDKAVYFNGTSLRMYYDKLFGDLISRKAFEDRLYEVTKKAIRFYSKIKANERVKQSTILEYGQLCSLFKLTRVNTLKTEYNMECFIQILIYRELYKIGILIFDFDPLELHYNLTDKMGFDEKYHASDPTGTSIMNRLANALWTNRLIPCSSAGRYNPIKIKNGIQKSLCEAELEYLERYRYFKKEITKDAPTPKE